MFLFKFPATTPRATTPHRSLFRLPRRGLRRPYRCIQASRLPRLQGYHTRATTLHERLGTGGLSHVRVGFSYFSFHRLIRRCLHNNNHNFPTEPGEHRTGTHNRTGDKFGRETAMFFLRRHRRGTLCYHLLQNSICELGCCPGRHSLRFWIYRLGGGCR